MVVVVVVLLDGGKGGGWWQYVWEHTQKNALNTASAKEKEYMENIEFKTVK